MRRVRYYEHGGPEVLQVEETDVPEPGKGQVRIRAEAIGANFVDVKFGAGGGASIFQRPLPGSLTGDVVGTVDAVGPDVDHLAVGDRVAALVAEDAVADQALADADWAVRLPDVMDAATATALPTVAPVALRVLRAGRLAPGETVLVHSGAGAIGHLAVQLAKMAGATVIATASTKAKLAFATEYGADVVVDYSDPDWPKQVREAVPGGVDVVLDAIRGEIGDQSQELLAPMGRMVVFGAASGDLTPVPVRGLFGLRSVTGFSLLGWRSDFAEQARREVAELAGHLTSGRLRYAVHATFPIAEVVAAYRVLDERGQSGRLILVP